LKKKYVCGKIGGGERDEELSIISIKMMIYSGVRNERAEWSGV